ncbi:response regulator [Paenibacillus xylanilyticus]|uniref:Response regulator n=1 Tax=Paenibacillus xylanilyticus TaxID=248903 RepID=A0A7Y6C281_9BACL|nr:response regulator [Paenibacillus xylanilyticus]NUU79242.1 response regulator [Paenibacillus xylanilyticus]
MINVLIVDDDQLVRKGLMLAMPWDAFEMKVIGEAGNGERALEFLSENRVDLLITDLAMPVMSGIELIRIARKQYPELPIAVLTLHQDFEYIQEALRLGAIDYIAKVQLEKERFEEVLGRIHDRILTERRKRLNDDTVSESDKDALFYGGADTGTQILNESICECEQSGSTCVEKGEGSLKDKLHSFRWVHDERYMNELLQELRTMRLPVPRLMQLLYGVTVDWNRTFKNIVQTEMTTPVHFASWQDVVEWMANFRAEALVLSGGQYLRKEVSSSILTAVKMVHDELQKPLFASDVSKRVNLSRSYFNQCFKEMVGYSFNEYLRKVRIDKARDYLTQTAKPIVWIAEHTGYADEKYFSRMFREQVGMLPSEYRNAPR